MPTPSGPSSWLDVQTFATRTCLPLGRPLATIIGRDDGPLYEKPPVFTIRPHESRSRTARSIDEKSTLMKKTSLNYLDNHQSRQISPALGLHFETRRTLRTMLPLWVVAICLGMSWCSLSMAQDKPIVATNADDAGADFAFQGEYLGSLGEGAEAAVGAQVIALGDGKFAMVAFHGGLPGEGGEAMDTDAEGTPGNPIPGERDGDSVNFRTELGMATIKDGKLTVSDPSGENVIANLEKMERKSPTLGATPPDGAVVLFDGTDAEAFENGTVTDGLLNATNCSTKQKLGDHFLHIEFRTPYMPNARGQGRGNSGVYAQGRYEIQVLDSFGLEGKNNECGGIYSIAEPDVNMCFPPLSWQTYDIEFKAAKYNEAGEKIENARINVKHNGVVIHDDVELPHGTPGYHPEGPGPDSLFLQNHGNPVHFRNIWVVDRSEK